MIEITHKQAQHLIREGQERRLPDAQWAMLQSHLETCAECAAYRQRLTEAQRGLAHALRLRWAGARGPKEGTAAYLKKRREQREQRRAWLVKVSRFGLVFVLLAAYLVYRNATRPRLQPVPAAPAQATAAVPAPTEEAVITFRGLVAYEERVSGSPDIMLLNVSGGQVDRSNLTQSAAAETHPAWSPDGEWIAFLSDQSGKNEIYLMTVAGSRLTQITDQPQIEWQGPLEWSYDGYWIALTGRREGSGDAVLYLVPTSGAEPQSVAFTRGAQPWARFSHTLPLLAFPSIEQDGGLSVLNIETGWTARVTAEDTDVLGYALAHPEAFDWSLGGRSLVYGAQSASASMLRISPELDARSILDFTGSGAQSIAAEAPGVLNAVTWVPNSLLVASLEAGPDGCRVVRLDHAYNRQVSPQRLDGLCVEGSLERASWSGDGNWLVLLARLRDETAPGIYAARLPEDDQPPLYERLGDATLIAGSDATLPPGPALRVRKIGRHLAITPHPAEPAGRTFQPIPAVKFIPEAVDAPEWVVYSVERGETGQIFRASLDGERVEPLTGSSALVDCPRVGPQGRVAYRSDMGRAQAGTSEIFVMDADGQNTNLLTPEGGRRYDCPVWSPDGRFLAAYSVTQDGEGALAVITADGSAPPFFLPVESSSLSTPVWRADDGQGAGRLLVIVPQGREPVQLWEFDLNLPEVERDNPRVLAYLTGWDDVWGATLSPDGTRLAMVPVLYNLTSNFIGPTSAQLRVLDLNRLETLVNTQLNNFDPYTVGRGGLVWLSDGQLGMVRTTGMIGSQKSQFTTYRFTSTDPDEATARALPTTIDYFEDVVFSAEWSAGPDPSRGTVVFNAESGLWVLNYHPSYHEMPLLLSGERISGMDWR